MRIGKRLIRGFKSFWCIYFVKCTPVLVYAPGRVGSVSMIESFDRAGILAIKLENLHGREWFSTNFVRTFIIKKKRPAQIISLVREPISLMVAYFFSIISKHEELYEAAKNRDIEVLGKEFVRRCLHDWPFEHFLMWHERELPQTIGVDVFAAPFDAARRWDFIEHSTYPTLILRSDLDDPAKEATIEQNFGHKISILKSNVGSEKKLADVYEQFKSEFRLTPDDFERIYDTKMAKHFFNNKDREEARGRWCSTL